jgi:hypothetical protein
MFPTVAADNRGYTVIPKTLDPIYARGKVIARRLE